MARTGRCIFVRGRKTMSSWRKVQNGTNGHLYTRAGAYNQVSRAYMPKRERASTCTVVQELKARFSGSTGPNGYERARAHTPRGVQPGFPGLQGQTGSTDTCTLVRGRNVRYSGCTGQNGRERGRAHTPRSVQPGFLTYRPTRNSSGYVHTRQKA